MKKFVALLLAVLMVASLCACGQKDTGSDLQTVTKGKLIMSTNAEFAPYEYVADDGKGFQGTGYEGIDIEIAYALAQKLGLELVVDNMDFEHNPKEFGGIIDKIDAELFGLFSSRVNEKD